MTSTSAAHFLNEGRYWANRSLPGVCTYTTWTRLPLLPSPSQTRPDPAAGAPASWGAAAVPESPSNAFWVASRTGAPPFSRSAAAGGWAPAAGVSAGAWAAGVATGGASLWMSTSLGGASGPWLHWVLPVTSSMLPQRSLVGRLSPA